MEPRFTVVNIGTLSMNRFWNESAPCRMPSATCTLIESDDKRLIVDPSPAPELLEPMLFAATGLRPADIHAVFITHFHGDHRFGLDLFRGIPWLMSAAGLDEWRRIVPGDGLIADQFVPAEAHLPPGIEPIATPGHTEAHSSLRFDTACGKVVVAGDAVMTRDFFDAKIGFHNSMDPAQATRTIDLLISLADFLVPGHGNYFPTRAAAPR